TSVPMGRWWRRSRRSLLGRRCGRRRERSRLPARPHALGALVHFLAVVRVRRGGVRLQPRRLLHRAEEGEISAFGGAEMPDVADERLREREEVLAHALEIAAREVGSALSQHTARLAHLLEEARARLLAGGRLLLRCRQRRSERLRVMAEVRRLVGREIAL